VSVADEPFDLLRTYVHLDGAGGALPVVLTPTFWQELMSGDHRSPGVARIANEDGWMVASFPVRDEISHWEIHPRGDELLCMLSGAIDVALEREDGTARVVRLEAGATCLVPRGTWHRLFPRAPGQLLAITYGKDTRHRPG
jgi:mannose-6-phosphate isomerase-like protein (cupin superfamily)